MIFFFIFFDENQLIVEKGENEECGKILGAFLVFAQRI